MINEIERIHGANALRGNHFDISDILDTIDNIISLQETTALTMETLLPSTLQTSNRQDKVLTAEMGRGERISRAGYIWS
ncbi:unnamed protein product [Cylicostephanus goldi]|uniref:Uncharacterized protein n=1 Tax=Cylicostephanus goldi TaxID=71465 RepID=A0A3P6S612_CYLGO|nr:unnamed protein product [Cylicostephanus goldi]